MSDRGGGSRRPILGALFGLAIGVLVVLVLTLLVRTWGLADQIRQAQKGNVSTLHVVRDCTDPGGTCFKRGQKSTAKAVASINKITVYAAACADKPGNQTVTQIQSCVIRKLAADDRRNP